VAAGHEDKHVRPGQQLGDARERQAGVGPLADAQQGFQMRGVIPGGARTAMRPREQAFLDIEAHRAQRQISRGGQLLQRQLCGISH